MICKLRSKQITEFAAPTETNLCVKRIVTIDQCDRIDGDGIVSEKQHPSCCRSLINGIHHLNRYTKTYIKRWTKKQNKRNMRIIAIHRV